MPRFPQLAAALGEPLELPVPLPSGAVKTYMVPPVDGETWTWLTARFASSSDDDEIDDTTEVTLYRRCLSGVYDELVADKAGWEQIRRCGLTALAWHVHGEEAALKVWEGGVPKPPSTSTEERTETPAEAPSTPRPASANGTTPSRKRATGSRGRASSTTGSGSKQTSTSSTASTSDSPAS